MEASEVYLTGPEICERLRICRSTWHKLIREGKFPNAVKLLREYRVPLSDLQAFIASSKVKPAA
jgi:excisionase family DNA binding protein